MLLALFTSCNEYNAVFKSQDIDFKYEAAKACYIEGRYSTAAELLGTLLVGMKGTPSGDECLYLLAMSNFKAKDYESAAAFFRKYYQSYPKGEYVEQARYYSGYSLYKQIPDVRLDQSSTKEAITEFNAFLESYPNTSLKNQTMEMIYTLEDQLIEKEFLAAKLYFDLGAYVLNCPFGGNNYEACVITAQNALKDYPAASPSRKEELSIMVLRAKYQLAKQSVEDKRMERYRDAIDEYYAFQNDFPESKYMKEANEILSTAEHVVKKKKWDFSDDEL